MVSSYQVSKAVAIDANRCVYPGCVLEPADDSFLCPLHRDDKRARNRRYAKQKRARWARERRCLDCGGRRKIGRKRCPACLLKRDRLKLAGVDKVVDKSARVIARAEGDGYQRARYRGQLRRGAQTKGALDDADLTDAIKQLERAKAALGYARSPEVQELPRIQRQEVVRAALSQADHAGRFIDEVLERNRYHSKIVAKPRDDEE